MPCDCSICHNVHVFVKIACAFITGVDVGAAVSAPLFVNHSQIQSAATSATAADNRIVDETVDTISGK